MLTTEQFDRTRRLASSLAGIELSERHRELVHRRGQRRGILDGAGMDFLLDAAEEGEPSARQELLCLLTTKFTGFFRHPLHFEIAAKHALRAVQQCGQARLWSAAAATGEEPWSLAMALIELFQHDHPAASIVATDVDANAVEVAQEGEYAEASVQAIDPARRDRFLNKASVPGRWLIAATVRHLVDFRTLNLVEDDWPVKGPFDVIFCRNVLIYLEARRRHFVLERLASLLSPDGLLMLDPTEHPGRAEHRFASRADGVYSLRREGSHAAMQLSTPRIEP